MRLGKEIKLSSFLKQIFLDIESFLSPPLPHPNLFFCDCNQPLRWIESNHVTELIYYSFSYYVTIHAVAGDERILYILLGMTPSKWNLKLVAHFWCDVMLVWFWSTADFCVSFLETNKQTPLPICLFVHCDGGCIVSRVFVVTVVSTWSRTRNNLKGVRNIKHLGLFKSSW